LNILLKRTLRNKIEKEWDDSTINRIRQRAIESKLNCKKKKLN